MSKAIEIEISESNPMTPKRFASEYGFDPKSVRRVMRSMVAADNQPGSGGRWNMDAEFVSALLIRMNQSHNKKVTVATIATLK